MKSICNRRIIVPVLEKKKEKENRRKRGIGNCWIIRDEGQSETIESIRLVSSSEHNRRANVSTRRMARFTLRAWLGRGEIAATRRFTWEILSSVGLPCHRWLTRTRTECLDNLSRTPMNLFHLYSSESRKLIPSLLWFQLRHREERIHPAGPRTRPGMPGISRQGSQSGAGKAISFLFCARCLLFFSLSACMKISSRGSKLRGRRVWKERSSFCRGEWTSPRRWSCGTLSPRSRPIPSYLWAASR